MKHERLYNAKTKERFLEQGSFSPSMERLFRNVFDLTAPYEEEYGADVCTWDIARCSRVLEILAGFRSYSSENRANLLRRYAKWCIEDGVPDASDSLLRARASGQNKVREMTLSGPSHLQTILDTIYSPVSDATSDNLLRGYCWLAYFGMSDKEIVDITSKDVDLKTFLIYHGGDVFPICKEAIPCMRVLKELSAFRYYHPGYDSDFIWRPRMDGQKLLRGIRSAEPSVMHFRSQLSTAVNAAFKAGKIDVKISHYRIWLSGEFYRMYQRERMGQEIDFSHLADRAVRIREARGEPYKLEAEKGKRTISGKKREIDSAYKEDYRRWKQAYHSRE